jgi:hypothetical protein
MKRNKEEINKGIIISGGEFKSDNIAIGDNATINQQFNSISEQIDFDRLLPQLTLLLSALKDKAAITDEFIALGKVGEAEKAAKENDGKGVMKYLKSAGTWVFDTAKEIGVDVVTDLIKKQLEP